MLRACAVRSRCGACSSFSGTLAGRWVVDGFVPPMFEAVARQRLQEPGEIAIATVSAQLDRIEAELGETRDELSSITTRHDAACKQWRMQHGRRPARPLRAAYKRMRSEYAGQQKPLRSRIGELEAKRAILREERAHMSMTLLTGMHDMINMTNARGETLPLYSVSSVSGVSPVVGSSPPVPLVPPIEHTSGQASLRHGKIS
jgi:tRNA pseudouridine32 synthase / 23S rRNA pseudouridine746 synthase